MGSQEVQLDALALAEVAGAPIERERDDDARVRSDGDAQLILGAQHAIDAAVERETVVGALAQKVRQLDRLSVAGIGDIADQRVLGTVAFPVRLDLRWVLDRTIE